MVPSPLGAGVARESVSTENIDEGEKWYLDTPTKLQGPIGKANVQELTSKGLGSILHVGDQAKEEGTTMNI